MKIVVNHLTRMGAGYVCVAGVDMETGKHVRPVLPEGPLPVDFLVRYRGPFDMGRLVDLGSVRPHPARPHVEDCVIVPSRLKPLGSLPRGEFWELLQRLSKDSLRDLFGPELECVRGQAWAVRPGKGEVSLGCFRPKTELGSVLGLCCQHGQQLGDTPNVVRQSRRYSGGSL